MVKNYKIGQSAAKLLCSIRQEYGGGSETRRMSV